MREKRHLIIAVCCLGCVLQASAITSDNPYQPIIERNVFALKPPAPAPTEEELAAKQPPPNIFLTGITTIFGNKRALLKSTPTASGPVKPGAEKPTEQSYMLTEGQRDGDVEVLQIDENAGSVKIRLAGKEMTLDFDKNGIKTAAAAPAAQPGGPAAPGMPPTGFFRPTALPGAPTTATPGSVLPSFNRTMRLPGSTQTSATGMQPGGMPYGGVAYAGGYSGGTATRLGMPSSTSAQPNVGDSLATAIENQVRKEDLIKQGVTVPTMMPRFSEALGQTMGGNIPRPFAKQGTQ